jgi:hypothetical protein
MILELLYDFHGNIIPAITGCAPILDEICCYVLDFINDCYTCDLAIVYFGIRHTTVSALFPFSTIIVFCSLRYDMPFEQLLASKRDRRFFDIRFFDISLQVCLMLS